MSRPAMTTVSTSPYLHDTATTPKIMWEVVFSLLPMVAAAWYFFGLGAFMVVFFSTMGSMLTEFFFTSGDRWKAVRDGSGLITGILLGLCLPPGFPLWMAFMGGVVAIGMGKVIWGGLGQNVFNPALVGRAFLQAAFPTAITTWSPPDGGWFSLNSGNAAWPFMQADHVDAISTATPLSQMKFEHVFAPTSDLFLGNIPGSLGETSSVLLLLAGIYLLVRKIINWRIPVSILTTVAVMSAIFWWIDPKVYPSPDFMLFSGGLLLGTFYMATDLVTSPITPKGLWWYGFGIGFFVVLIRLWGGLPEGVMYAILLMNAATPLINKFTRIKPYGYR
ncbi:MAG: RnfABCDGE type electron transport complex subunit D [Bacteroidota bacterium]|nr:RnfABCDGE type electron transport complex subunit D [Bacteroidota bacterium]MDX5428007.1 RnfABCDGE type electron transport complex subunit D [Bacteroidota bacterium]MDX5448142.1 RnfABCDGE type electron transport complex subunit D [Bacteroidota bacterium]MDX5505848.1 RnfABCDGE type electron transport complex subunit D [Bacteroidota bacterium]